MKLESIKAAIFDLDGTLFDSMNVWLNIDKTFLERRGLPVTPDYHQAIKNMKFLEAAEYTKARYNLSESPEEIAREWEDMALCAYRDDVLLKPFVKELLLALRQRGVKLGVATSNRESLYKHVFVRCGIEDFFTVVVTTQETKPKSFPDVYLEAARRLGELPQNSAVFEDILVGAQSAKKAGFSVIGVRDETSAAEEENLRLVCDYYIHSFEELF